MSNFPFDLVGFDLDGTLLDTSGDLGIALNHALALAGRTPVGWDQARTFVGGGTRMMLHRALMASGGPLPEDEVDALTTHLVAHYEANIAVHTQPFPGALAAMDTLAARGVHLALVTNKLERLARKLLAELGLTDRFYTIIGGDTLGRERAKPKPDMLHLMVERSGLAAPRAVYVGDTYFDVDAAKAAGIPVVAMRYGFSNTPVDDLGANVVIDHFDDLVAALEGLGTPA